MCHKLWHIFSISGAFVRHRTPLCAQLGRGDSSQPPFPVNTQQPLLCRKGVTPSVPVLGSAWHSHSSADIVQRWLAAALSKAPAVAHKFTQLHGCICSSAVVCAPSAPGRQYSWES